MSLKYISPVALIAASVASLHVQSAGFQVNEHSASGLGRAFAGEAVVADNASVIARNPAAMSRFDKKSISALMSLVVPKIDVEAANIDDPDTPERQQVAKNVAPTSIIPALYYIHPINESLAWGLGLFSGYGVATDYPDDFHAGSSAGKTSLLTMNINPSISYKVNSSWSFGAGVSLIYAQAELYRHYGSQAKPIYPNKLESDKTIQLEGHKTGWGWNIGATYDWDANNRFGIAYRSEVDLKFKGDFTDYSGLVLANTASNSIEGELPVILPATIEVSGHHVLSESFSLQYSALWTQWSKFKELRATNPNCTYNGQQGICLYKKEEYTDNIRYAIGTTYALNNAIIVRGGFAYDEQAGETTLSIPDTDRYWYSAGFTYMHSADLSFDLGMTYLQGQERRFIEDGLHISSTAAYIGAAQVNFRF